MVQVGIAHRLRRLKIFLDFWHSPWGAAKNERWEWFTRDATFHVDVAYRISREIIEGKDGYLDWVAFEADEKQLELTLGVG